MHRKLTSLKSTEKTARDSLPHSLAAGTSIQASSRTSSRISTNALTILARRPLVPSEQLAYEPFFLDRLGSLVVKPEAVGTESRVGVGSSDGGGATSASKLARSRGGRGGGGRGRGVMLGAMRRGRLGVRVGRGRRVLGRVSGVYTVQSGEGEGYRVSGKEKRKKTKDSPGTPTMRSITPSRRFSLSIVTSPGR